LKSPRIYLAIDNCFASKRWTEPGDWIKIVKDLGLNYIEASADNECDPLYSTTQYLEIWKSEILNGCVKAGIQISNLYSGHGTYSTLGLAHTHKTIQDHIHYDWLGKMIDNASELGAGLGFFCHAFNQNVLQDPKAYSKAYKNLIRRFSELSTYAKSVNLKSIAVEQMYTPHQIPWTITGAKNIITEVFRYSGHPFYITIDVGHQSGQRKFLRPDIVNIKQSIEAKVDNPSFWLGTKMAYCLYQEALNASKSHQEHVLEKIKEEINARPHLFAKYSDGDPYRWLKDLGAYSPIIHLQQTDGTHSSHKPFTEEYNSNGIILGNEVLNAISASYQSEDPGFPPKCDEIFLTIEVFSSTSDNPFLLLKDLETTVEYWRNFVPEDGLGLDELLEN
jgi:sugar phosphate isomerase/epimerase